MVEDLLSQYCEGFDGENYIEGLRYFHADSVGKVIGMPLNSSTPLLYWNKGILAELGVDVPPMSWEEFEAKAPKFK